MLKEEIKEEFYLWDELNIGVDNFLDFMYDRFGSALKN